MALLAKMYLTYSSPMGMGQDMDPVRRRTYQGDGAWRPGLSPQSHNNVPTSAPNSPRVSRKTTWHTSGNRSSCDGGDNHQSTAPVKTPQRSFSVRRVGSVRRRASPFHARRDITDQNGGAASAPTSPHFGIDKSESSMKLPIVAPRGEKSMPSSPSQNMGENRQSPPMKTDSASHRRSHFGSMRRIKKNQSFAGVSEFTAAAGSASAPNSGGSDVLRSPKESTEAAPIRRRCASGPLDEDVKAKAGEAHPKTPELLITLSYSKNASFMTITINKAKNLSESSGAFVRVHLYEGFKPISLKQTGMIQGGADIEIKQAFVFSLPKDNLWSTHILVELFEHDIIGNECKYGDVVIGPKAGGNGFVQWRQVCTHPNIPCSMWHNIM